MANQQLKFWDPVVLDHAELVCESPKSAFWNIRLEAENGTFAVIKESGIGTKVIDRRRWPHDSLDKATRDYRRRLMAKLNPNRRSSRIYRKKRKNEK